MFETEDDDDVPSMPQTLMGTARSTQQMHQKSIFALDDDDEEAEAVDDDLFRPIDVGAAVEKQKVRETQRYFFPPMAT